MRQPISPHREQWSLPTQSRVGQAMAVLGSASTVGLIAELLEADDAAVQAVVRRIGQAPIRPEPRDGDRNLRDDNRRRLHYRAAELLHHKGFPPHRVADQLVEAGMADYPWAAGVLRAAAADALTNDQIDRAVERLELAYRATRDPADRAVLAIRLVTIEWRINPSGRTRNFTRMRTALGAGRVPGPALPAAIMFLLWHGQTQHADHALAQLVSDRPGEPGPEVEFLGAWLRYSHPPHAQRRSRPRPASATDPESPHRLGADLLDGLCTRPLDEIATLAQRLLTNHRLASTTVETLVAAVQCLIYSDRLDTAVAWCDALLAEADARRAPTWQSIFAGLRAEAMLHTGNVRAAADDAMLALKHVPAEHLGVWAALPIAASVRALTVAGRYTEAGAQLDRAVPRTVFESRFGLPYLHAHGHYQLALGRADDALRTFRRCGFLMRRWTMDFPWLIPWRNDIAAAYLALGEHRQARVYATQHLDLLGGADRHRTGGVSLRLLATTADRYQRVRLLRESATIARAGGDELELATVLGDLARAHRAVGDHDKSRALVREAARMAETCSATPLLADLLDGKPRPTTQPLPVMPRSTPGLDALSPAERRVADLAARGRSNRDIAATQGITTSTVEQHLTRVYRKLGIARRSELRFILPTGASGRAASQIPATG